MRAFVLILCCLCLPGLALANDKLVRLHAPEALVQSGLLKYALPRFSLKTQVRTEFAPSPEAADLVFGDRGKALFEGAGQVWHMDIRSPDHPGTARLADWLSSEVGQRTVFAFAPEGAALFAPPSVKKAAPAPVSFDGDADLGHKVSRAKCVRCHAVDAATRGWGIGSTPSFGILRALPDWEQRFAAFYALKPHPAFTQVIDLTDPFPIDRPSPIAPIELTLDEFDAILAYVAAMKAADLGDPLKHQ
jgi:hypothetical protein